MPNKITTRTIFESMISVLRFYSDYKVRRKVVVICTRKSDIICRYVVCIITPPIGFANYALGNKRVAVTDLQQAAKLFRHQGNTQVIN